MFCDVESDLKDFNLEFSFQSRVDSSSVQMFRILMCVNLDSLFALLCGERLESVWESWQWVKVNWKDMVETFFKSYLTMFVQAQANFGDENNDKLLFEWVQLKMKQSLAWR